MENIQNISSKLLDFFFFFFLGGGGGGCYNAGE